jgi:hypothetical protein
MMMMQYQQSMCSNTSTQPTEHVHERTVSLQRGAAGCFCAKISASITLNQNALCPVKVLSTQTLYSTQCSIYAHATEQQLLL